MALDVELVDRVDGPFIWREHCCPTCLYFRLADKLVLQGATKVRHEAKQMVCEVLNLSGDEFAAKPAMQPTPVQAQAAAILASPHWYALFKAVKARNSTE